MVGEGWRCQCAKRSRRFRRRVKGEMKGNEKDKGLWRGRGDRTVGSRVGTEGKVKGYDD